MGIGTFLEHLFQRRKDPEEIARIRAREEALARKIRERCSQFRRLLARNKNALELMSDLEEHLQSDRSFGMGYVRATGARVTSSVYQMVQSLATLSENRYPALQESFDRIAGQIDALISQEQENIQGATCPYILPLSEIRLQHTPFVGGKMANLGEIAATVGLAVPPGFAITVSAFDYFMEYNGLLERIQNRIQATDLTDIGATMQLSQSLQQSLLTATIPPDLEQAILSATQDLTERCGEDVLLACRSSAVGEDSKSTTFAGQYRSELNIPPEEVCPVWKEILASKYSLSAMSYRFQHGIPDDAAPMSVGVLAMVRARAGGVAYSRDPVHAAAEQIVINAVAGLPQGVVDGGVIPDVFYLDRTDPPEIVRSSAGQTDAGSVLSEDRIRHMARIALILENFYGEPQDVEWALNEEDELIILQSRPLQVEGEDYGATDGNAGEEDAVTDRDGTGSSVPCPPEDEILAACGIPAAGGVGIGAPCIVRKEADMLSFPEGAILVVERAFPRWAALLPRAAGLVSERGGTAGHLASVAREYHIPALFSVPDACTLLAGAECITLDASRARIYRGSHPELIREKAVRPSAGRTGQEYERLQALARLVVPLHLLDPQSPGFRPENCTTLHDVTRFCHEKAVNHLFLGEDTQGQKIGKQLRAGAKLQYWVVDMGHAFAGPVSGDVVDIRDIVSQPMQALWEGMTKIPWAGPPSSGAAGFMSVVLESTMNPELESTAPSTMTERNFFIVDAGYMILQARYGYHFCTVESQATEKSSENFVTFQFKGGAADRDRRILRVRMLGALLEEFQFRVDVKEDALFAVAEGFSCENILRRTALIGYLLIHSRQSDTIMLDHERAEAFRVRLFTDMQNLFQMDLTCSACGSAEK